MPAQTAATAVARKIPSNEASGGIRYALRGRVLKRNFLIAVIVGTLLTMANQFDLIVRGSVHADLLAKVCFNFLIPFVVSSVSAYANRCGP